MSNFADSEEKGVGPSVRAGRKRGFTDMMNPFQVPTKLKELLETRILEGLTVTYRRKSKNKGRTETHLRGQITGTGISCFCNECKGKKVVTPIEFETHAGSLNKKPAEYMYLENGKTLREVLNACKVVPPTLESVKEAILKAVRGSSSEKQVLTPCTNTCVPVRETTESCPVPVQRLYDRKSSGQAGPSNPRIKGRGALRQSDSGMHKFALSKLPNGTKLMYCAPGEKEGLIGRKEGAGILCTCCDKEISPSQFEIHAGHAARRKPYSHIFLPNRSSLHEYSLKFIQERNLSREEHENVCYICESGKDLIYCQSCRKTVHQNCLPISTLPSNTWRCDTCEQLDTSGRAVRVVETAEPNLSSCCICRANDFDNKGFSDRTVIMCDQCDKEFHIGCLREHNLDDLDELPDNSWFCTLSCKEVNKYLTNLTKKGEMNLPDPHLDVIKKKNMEKGSTENLDVKWRLFRGHSCDDETSNWLSKAVELFHEQFQPIRDGITRDDLIRSMVFGNNIREHDNLRGMYTAAIIVNSEIVSAAIFRIWGTEVGELPLVATKGGFQGLGYFQSLLNCIENILRELNVKNIMLPSAETSKSIWIKKFGFVKMSDEQFMAYKDFAIMPFGGTTRLHKPLRT